ncbi:unnamed protein product [Rotaria sp. Silwood2]|nr:unnamed protein product [Rotaria sp. Silwood2]
MTLPAFHNTLLISSIFPYQTEKHLIISPRTERHCFLNGLALLLNGSKPCTSVYPWLTKKQLLITRNEPLTKDDEIYFNDFFRCIRIYSSYCLTSNQEGMTETYSILKSIVLQYNKDKCIERILDPMFNDAVFNLEKLLNYDIDEICQNVSFGQASKSKSMIDYINLKEENIPLKEYISILFNWIKRIISIRESMKNDKYNIDVNKIENFQECCELLLYSKIFRSIVSYIYSVIHVHERILYYLNKVSEHLKSFDLIFKTLERRKFDYGEIYKNIQWYFIEPIKNIVKLNEAPSSSFDKIWLTCDLADGQTKIDFKREYIGNKFVDYDSKLELSTCLHSEIRIIDYLIEQNIYEVRDGDIEIGIAKQPCYPCSLYIEQLNQKFNRNFYVADLKTHGKIYANWTFRNNEDDFIENELNDKLYRLIRKELIQFERTNRKNSWHSDKQETGVDDNNVDMKFIKLIVDNMIKRKKN